MAETCLINAEQIKKYSTLNGSVDDNMLYPHIYLAQDMYLQQYLGTDLIEKLKDFMPSTPSGNYGTLYTDYVVKCLVWWTIVEAVRSLVFKVDNGSIVRRVSEDTQTISESEVAAMTDWCNRKAMFYTQRLINYLCENSSLFPEYTSNSGADMSPRRDLRGYTSYAFSSGNTAMSSDGQQQIDALRHYITTNG